MMKSLLLVLLITSIAVVQGQDSPAAESNIVKQFPTPADNTVFYSIVNDNSTGNIYVGSVNWIYVLDANLEVKRAISTGPKEDNENCDPNPTKPCDNHVRVEMDSEIMALAIDPKNRLIIACSNRYYGYCFKISMDTFNILLEVYTPIISNRLPPVLVVGPGINSEGVLYVGTTQGTGLPSFKNRVPMLAVRELDDFDVAHVDQSSASLMDILDQYREDFLVEFVKGFTYGGFTYFLVVRRESPDKDFYKTKLIRICQKDKTFKSYIELPLECEHYPLLQDAWIGKAGKALATKYGILSTDDVLYTVFASALDGSTKRLGLKSAICMYSMAKVENNVWSSIKLCFSGTAAKLGPQHILQSAIPCTRMNYPIPKTYCGEAGINHPIDSNLKVEVIAKYTDIPYQLSSIAVKHTGDGHHTVALLGTKNGKLLKTALEADSEDLTVYGIEDVGEENNPVHRDMFFDADKHNVYVMTDKQLTKLKITPECNWAKTCEECMAFGDPHCGWCTMENTCTRSRDCSAANKKHGWLPYNNKLGCPHITNVNPKIMQWKDRTTTHIELDVNLLPGELQTLPLECTVTGNDETRKTKARLGTKQIVCDPFNLLPNFPENQGHLDMVLSVRIYDRPWVSSNLTVYNCALLNSCRACTDTAFPCEWCLEQSECVSATDACDALGYNTGRRRRQLPPTAISQPYTNDDLGAASPEDALSETVLEAPVPGTRVTAPNECPYIDADKKEWLTPAGVPETITVFARNLKVFQLRDLKCSFEIGSGLVVNATYEYDEQKMYYVVTCQPTGFTYHQNVPEKLVPMSLIWDVNKPVDNPYDIHVLAFKCGSLAGSCGRCLLLPARFDCGWCGSQCSRQAECAADLVWLGRAETCQDAVIDAFTPTSGPLNGGTILTITGVNLGKNVTDFTSITAAGIPCEVIDTDYVPSQRVLCKTGRITDSNQHKEGPIHIVIKEKVKAQSSGNFLYAAPIVVDFYPMQGPQSGGTRVVINGEHLDIGSQVEVYMGENPSNIIKRNFTHLEFQSPEQPRSMKIRVKVKFDGGHDHMLNAMFHYTLNPTVDVMSRKSGLVSGGVNITFQGSNFATIVKPEFVMKVDNFVHVVSNCTKKSTNLMECALPDLSGKGLTPGVDDPVFLHYGLIMDGVQELRNLSQMPGFARFAVYPDPVITPMAQDVMKYEAGMRLRIVTPSGGLFNKVSGLQVSVGEHPCEIVLLEADFVECIPPTSSAQLNDDGNAEVKVQHGSFYSHIGWLKYRNTAATVGAVVGGVVGAIALVCLIILLVFLIRREKRRRKKKQMPPVPRPEPRELRQEDGLLRSTPQENERGGFDRYHDARPINSNGAAAATPEELEHLNPKKGAEVTYDDPPPADTTDTPMDTGEPFKVEDFLQRVKSNRLRKSIMEVLVPKERLELNDVIGRGHFGCVYSAMLRDENHENPTKVAVKTLQAYTTGYHFNQQAAELFLKEGVSMRNFEHAHVLKLLGVCFDDEAQPMVILPYMAKGDLRTYIKDKKKNFTARQLLHLARQVAEGMAYLAGLNFVHRDLAARNCMIDETDCVKVADFGLSRDLYEKDYYSSKDLDRKGKMPIKWMAIESLEDFIFTTKSDVWSFGVLLWELLMRGVTPYPDVDVFDVRNFLASGRRLRKPKYCPENIYKIMTDCWHAEPEMRPTFTDLVNRIELMLNPPPKATPRPEATSPGGGTAPGEGEQIYMNLSRMDSHDYLHPVDNTDGTVSFSPVPPPTPARAGSGVSSPPTSPPFGGGDVAVGYAPPPPRRPPQSPPQSPPPGSPQSPPVFS